MQLTKYFSFICILLYLVCYASPDKKESDLEYFNTPLDERQLGPIGLTVLGGLILPILIPVGVARLVSRLTNLGNSTSSTGVTVRPVILPGRPLFGRPLGRPLLRPLFGNADNNRKHSQKKRSLRKHHTSKREKIWEQIFFIPLATDRDICFPLTDSRAVTDNCFYTLF